MKLEYLNKQKGNRSLILIFAGWSTFPDLYRGTEIPGWDTAVVYDYSNFILNTDFLDRYTTIWLFAWSLGVKAAALSLPAEKITAAFAINGTLTPADDSFGIPIDIYNGTADNLNERNLKKFRRRMASDAETFRDFLDKPTDEKEIESLRNQLYLLRDATDKVSHLPWKRAYISTDDKIFPPQNMADSWKRTGVEIQSIPGSHYLPMSEIVKSVIPDLRKIADRFGKAVETYEHYAFAQRMIAERLTDKISDFQIPANQRILEVGPGTGIFTRCYSSVINPYSIDFVDLALTPALNIAPEENYYQADAEAWMENCTETYECIFSASAVQWFTNLPAFIKNCHRSLKDNGTLALSSFLPGNLSELDSLRPSPIFYHDIPALESMLKPWFTDIRIESEVIKLSFPSHREMMLHLKHTGVGGSTPATGASQSKFSGVTTLTYRPVYITCRKRNTSCNTL